MYTQDEITKGIKKAGIKEHEIFNTFLSDLSKFNQCNIYTEQSINRIIKILDTYDIDLVFSLLIRLAYAIESDRVGENSIKTLDIITKVINTILVDTPETRVSNGISINNVETAQADWCLEFIATLSIYSANINEV